MERAWLCASAVRPRRLPHMLVVALRDRSLQTHQRLRACLDLSVFLPAKALKEDNGASRRQRPRVGTMIRVAHADRRQKAAQCGMARVTYFDLEGAAPRVTWRGVPFRDGEAVVLDDARHAELVEAASTHPWFSVDRDDAGDADEPEASAPEAAAGFLRQALANGPVPQTAG